MWAPIGESVQFKVRNGSISFSMIAAISNERVEGIQLRKGTVNRFVFLSFLIKLIKELKIQREKDRKDFIFYLDNASYHACGDIQEAFKLLGVDYIFAPPYYCSLNPIEYFFQNLKLKVNQKSLHTR